MLYALPKIFNSKWSSQLLLIAQFPFYRLSCTLLVAGELDADEEIQQLQKDIIYTVRLTASDANKYLEQFLCYDYIWLDDKHLRLASFLKECKRRCIDDEHSTDDDSDSVADDGDGTGNANADSDAVCDPNLQTEMFQNQVGGQAVFFLFFIASRSRMNWLTARNLSYVRSSGHTERWNFCIVKFNSRTNWNGNGLWHAE